MNRLTELLGRYGTRTLLIGAAAVLLLLNIGRFAVNYYQEQQEEAVSRTELLAQYRAKATQLPELKRRVAALERQKRQLQNYLFTGSAEEEIASSMQIMLQEMVVKAGLEPESLRPIRGADARNKELGEIAIKMRLSGSLQAFVELLADLYRSKHLFRIESFTLKPYNKTDLKLFLDLKGYYTLAKAV